MLQAWVMSSKKPYPGFPPNYKEVETTGGYRRTCFVLEFLSLGQLEPTQIAMIEEQVEAMVEKLGRGIPTVEKVEFVTQDRFDPILLEGLRLPPK